MGTSGAVVVISVVVLCCVGVVVGVGRSYASGFGVGGSA